MNTDFTKVEKLFEEKMAQYNIPSLSIAVVSGDQIVYTGCFGFKDKEAGLPPDLDTRYGCASVTKAMTATCLGILKDEGKLDWDVPVSRYIPGFTLMDPAAAGVTLCDMLTHNTGVPRHEYSWINRMKNDRSTAEYVARIAHLKPNKPFRTKYEYNNFMYAAAGHVVEKIADMPLADFMKKKLFDPLGMANTTCAVAGVRDAENAAKPYRMVDDVLTRCHYLNFDGLAGAGALNSTLRDMTAWASCNLGGGEYRGTRVISQNTLAEIHTPRIAVPPMPKGALPHMPLCSYGFGWNVQPYRGRRYIHHSGNTYGFSAYLGFLPDENIGIVAFTNLESSSFHFAMVNSMYDHLLGIDDGTDWATLYYNRKKEMSVEVREKNQKVIDSRRPGTTPAHPLEDFAGHYEHPGYSALEIAVRDGELHMLYNNEDFTLAHNNYDTFDFIYERDESSILWTVSFRTAPTGTVEALAIPFEPSLDQPIVFTRRADKAE